MVYAQALLIETTDERAYEAEWHRYQAICELPPAINLGPSSTIVRPLLLLSGRAQSSSSCGHRSASPGSGATRADRRKRVTCLVRFMAGSPRASMHRT